MNSISRRNFCYIFIFYKSSTDKSSSICLYGYDSAELCELIGIYIQSLLESTLEKYQMGLYRNDNLIIEKNIISVFKNTDFKTEITTNFFGRKFYFRKKYLPIIRKTK